MILATGISLRGFVDDLGFDHVRAEVGYGLSEQGGEG